MTLPEPRSKNSAMNSIFRQHSFPTRIPPKNRIFGRVQKALIDYKEELLKKQTPVASTISQELLDSAKTTITSGRCIPFLGYGVFGEGPLSKNDIIQAFSLKFQESCLATSAEYLERFLRSREEFLNRLSEIITEQEKQVTPPAVHDLLVRVNPPPLIIITTLDLVLEKRLAATGKPLLILCHVIRSWDEQHDGKVLVFKGPDDATPDLQAADAIDLSSFKEAYIVYKPLGSPLLNNRLDPNMQIDTVAITESDHLTMFGRLKNQSTGVPTVLSRYFQRFPIIFLGYLMDMWHFRLVGQVFRSIDVKIENSASVSGTNTNVGNGKYVLAPAGHRSIANGCQ